MKKLSKYQLSKVRKNLDAIFNQATTEDIQAGKLWYKDANEFCLDTHESYPEFSPLKIASVLSALSPRNKWAQNKLDTIKVLDAVRQNKQPEDISVCTFHTNKFKAFELARNKDKFIDISSRKTFSFVNNIAHLDPNFVTIDVWHLRACFGETMGAIGILAYAQIERLTIIKATELGLKGYEYQAIIWGVIQKMWGNKE